MWEPVLMLRIRTHAAPDSELVQDALPELLRIPALVMYSDLRLELKT